MANLPQLITREQLIGLIIDSMLSRLPEVNDLNPGSTLTQLAESVGQVIYKPYADVISMIDALSVDRAVGEALQRLAIDANVPIFPALPSSGNVNITDLTFNKIQTILYSGQPAPVAGSLVIYVSDASQFLSSGTIYIGRGTNNAEGPLTYTSITSQSGGTYYAINLSPTSPTVKFHNIGETVVMGQGGNRVIPAGTVVQTAQGQLSTSLSFFTTLSANILDGEVTSENIPVVSNQAGTISNIPIGAIQIANGLSFSASASNSIAFTNGRDADTDQSIRQRIKDYEQLKSKGTSNAIKAASLNITSPDELKTTTSSNIVTYADNSAALVFDDGTGYEPIFSGIGLETVIDQALGGETNLQLRNIPVAQARFKTNVSYPYNIPNLYNLSVSVNGTSTTHQFKSTDFVIPTAGTALEVAASINANAILNFSANTSDGGKNVVIFPRNPNNNNIKVNSLSSADANTILKLPADTDEYTLRLYKNDNLLYQDGLPAQIKTKSKAIWSTGIIPNDTLIYNVDNTQNITVTLTNAAFQKVNPISTVSSIETVETWSKVFNSLMPGVKAEVSGDQIVFSSNKGLDSTASLEFVGGSLLGKIFDINLSLSSQGQGSDYTLNRNTSQIGLAVEASTGDSFTAGSKFTRAKVLTTDLPNGVLTAGNLWFILDGASEIIPSGIRGTTQIKFTYSSGTVTLNGRNIINTSTAEGFESVLPGDWLLVWTNGSDGLETNNGFWRVETAETGQLTFKNGSGSSTGWITNPPINKILLVRSLAPVQEVSYTAPSSLASLQSQIGSQLLGSIVDIVGSKIRISTATFDSSGEILCIAADESASSLLIPTGTIIKNTTSHVGYNITNDLNYGIPSFTYDSLSSVNLGLSELFPTLNYLELNGDESDYIEFLDQFDITAKSNIPQSNKKRRIFVKNYDALSNFVTGSIPDYMSSGHSVPQTGDRFFLRKSYQLDYADTVNTVIDNNTETKYYSLPVSRKVIVGNAIVPTTTSFSADDGQSNLALNDVNSFNGFDFSDFKVWRKAYCTIQDLLTNLNIKVLSGDFGPSGNLTRFGFLYPTDTSQTSLSHQVSVSDTIDVGIILPIKTVRNPSWDGTSAFTVSVLPGVNGEEYATYQYKVGTQPSLITVSNVSTRDLAVISSNSDFLSSNEGFSAEITSVTPTSFTVKRKIGSSLNDAIVFDSIDMDGTPSSGFPQGKITVTYSGTHNISTGNRIGLYDTTASAGNPSSKPLNGTYFASNVSGSTITLPANTGVPGSIITSATLNGAVLRVYTNTSGLYVGDLVKFRNIGLSFSNKVYQVSNLSVSYFECVIDNTAGTFSISASSRYDFQSYTASATNSSILSSVSRSGSTVTVTLPVAPSYSPSNGDLIQISGLTIQNWNSATTYANGDVIKYNSSLYKSLQNSNLNHQPDINPAYWTLTDESMEGVFIVTSVSGNQFTYNYKSSTGSCSASGGTVIKMISIAKLARCIGGSSSYLKIASVSSTAQEVIDYVSNNMSSILSIENNGGDTTALINLSTENSGQYLTGSITDYQTIKNSRRVYFTTSTIVPKGATISVSGISSDYNATYTVLNSVPSGLGSLITCQSSKIAGSTTSNLAVASYLGSLPFLMLYDGSNSVSLSNLSVNPQFNLKKSWVTAPPVGEELYLVASNKTHLNALWNRLIISGIDNVASVENAKFNEELQISTQTLGSTGSVEILGGTANTGIVAVIGSGADQNGKLGLITIPYQLKKGMVVGNWISLSQIIQEKKYNTFDNSTVIDVTNTSSIAQVSIVSGSGSFINKRNTTADTTTTLKIERHGNFSAIIRIDGSSPSLYTAGVSEGDWVRIANKLPQAWNSGTTYSVGNKVKYGISQLRYIAIQSGSNKQPDTSPLYWKQYNDYSSNSSYSIGDYVSYSDRIWIALAISSPLSPVLPGSDSTVWRNLEFEAGNVGIYRVVRTYGQDAFWVDAALTEEVTTLLDPQDLSFYDYDSVMPGDVLVVSGDVLGQKNIGRYTVLDDAIDGSSMFPTTTTVYTTAMTENVVLGSLNNKVDQFYFLEESPVKMYKKILSIGPGNDGLANILLDSPELITRVSSSNSAYLTMLNKINFDTNIHNGIDGYQSYSGLMQEVNKVIYGDPSLPIQYPGIKAAGANVDIKPSLIKKISMSVSVRIKTGLTYSEMQDSVRNAIAGYISSLGVGESVSLSAAIAAATNIDGVVSVVITSPTFALGSDLITLNPDEKALVINPPTDITVSITGT